MRCFRGQQEAGVGEKAAGADDYTGESEVPASFGLVTYLLTYTED